MKNNYYYFISGLPDISFEDQKPKISIQDFKSQLKENISSEDYKLIGLFFQGYDHINILNLLQKREEPFQELGNYDRQELENYIKIIREEGIGKVNQFPEYLEKFIFNFYNETPAFPNLSIENQLTTLYYHYVLGTDNKFIRDFFEFELNRLNILTALNCRMHKIDSSEEILGHTETSEAIRKSNAKDFGIGNDVDFTDSLIQLYEITDIHERERRIDRLRWEYLENAVFFYYFSIEKLFSYLIKIEILDRWSSLDKEKGNEKFKEMLNQLENSYEFPSEYKIK